jgi:hypothetical protein
MLENPRITEVKRPWRKWENNNKLDLTEVGHVNVNGYD